MKYTEDFIIRVNEVYHDIEAKDYQRRHPEIFVYEKERWISIIHKIIAEKKDGWVFLDIGAGTGFVPVTIAKFLDKKDVFFCTDISQKSLDICKENIKSQRHECTFKFIKTNGNTFDVPDNSVNIVTINSVLHHIPLFGVLFNEVKRILKKDGYLVLCHEPNRAYYTNWFLLLNHGIFSLILKPQWHLKKILRILGLKNVLKFLYNRFSRSGKFINDVNKKLLDERIIINPLTSFEISEIVDIQLYGVESEKSHRRGISIESLLRNNLNNFSILYLETYNHLGMLSNTNKATRFYSRVLKHWFPYSGGDFCLVLKFDK